PSSTSTSSYGRPQCFRHLRTDVKRPDSCALSRKTGITTERNGRVAGVLFVWDSSISSYRSGRHPYFVGRKPEWPGDAKFGRKQTQRKGMRIRKSANILKASPAHHLA